MSREPSDITAELLQKVSDFIRRYVVLTGPQADVCSIWCVHTHAIDATDFTPYLDINSPVLRSGKTRLLEVLRLLVRRPWLTARVTGSALVRKVDKDHPTLLLDECDAAFQTRGDYGEVLRGILNAGFERDGTYSMCVQKGNDWEPRDFKTFCPKAIAGIGNLPATIRDRSIPIRLKRAKAADNLQRLRKRKVTPEGEKLRQRIEEWAQTNTDKARESMPILPDQLNDRQNDRQQDVCEPLLAIADLADGCWPARARAALIELCSGMIPSDDSTGLRLVSDTRDIFTDLQTDRLSTRQLLERLHAPEDSPWREFDHGRRLNAYRLSQLLRPFEVRPRDIRLARGVQKGYLRADLEETWECYLQPLELVQKGQQAQHVSVHAGLIDLRLGQQQACVAHARDEQSPVNMQLVADVALSGSAIATGTRDNKHSYPTCWIHPENKSAWWLRGKDLVCDLCHPQLPTVAQP